MESNIALRLHLMVLTSAPLTRLFRSVAGPKTVSPVPRCTNKQLFVQRLIHHRADDRKVPPPAAAHPLPTNVNSGVEESAPE
jgi:hypothetical protein